MGQLRHPGYVPASIDPIKSSLASTQDRLYFKPYFEYADVVERLAEHNFVRDWRQWRQQQAEQTPVVDVDKPVVDVRSERESLGPTPEYAFQAPALAKHSANLAQAEANYAINRYRSA